MRLIVRFFSLCSLFFILILYSPSWATNLSFHPTTSSIGVADTVIVDVIISDMQNVYLGAFDFNINFDESVLTYNSYALGSQLGDIAAGEADDWSWGYLGSGTLHLSELSWLWDLSFQPDEFTLATLSFSGANTGSSGLSFSDVILSDDWGYELQPELSGGLVEVVAPVPEPGTMILLGTGLIGLAGARRRSKK